MAKVTNVTRYLVSVVLDDWESTREMLTSRLEIAHPQRVRLMIDPLRVGPYPVRRAMPQRHKGVNGRRIDADGMSPGLARMM